MYMINVLFTRSHLPNKKVKITLFYNKVSMHLCYVRQILDIGSKYPLPVFAIVADTLFSWTYSDTGTGLGSPAMD